MGQSKASLLEEMRNMCVDIKTVLVVEDVAIKASHLHVPEDGDEYLMTFVREGYVWLLGVYTTEYAAYIETKTLLPDILWKRYKEWGGFEEHREVVRLTADLKNLRSSLISRKRADFFKKSKRSGKHKVKSGNQATSSSTKP